jgi:hypothetical protein
MNRNRKIALAAGGGILAVVAVGSCDNDEPTIATATTPATVAIAEQPEMATESIDTDVLALDLLWPEHGPELCAAMNELAPSDETTEPLIDFAVAEFEKGYGQQLSAAAEQHLRDLLRSC